MLGVVRHLERASSLTRAHWLKYMPINKKNKLLLGLRLEFWNGVAWECSPEHRNISAERWQKLKLAVRKWSSPWRLIGSHVEEQSRKQPKAKLAETLNQLAEGLYQLELKDERLVAEVRMTMQGQWPEKREVLMAHPLSGPPRFPWTVEELLAWGCKFRLLKLK